MTNIEIKARYRKNRRTVNLLRRIKASYEGIEKQIDTYFQVTHGLLKIRERIGKTSQLIQYVRSQGEGPVPSHYDIVELKNVDKVLSMMIREHGLLGVVRKERELWIYDNVRIHFDRVERLGEFLEIEAVMDATSKIEAAFLKVRLLMDRFDLTKKNLVFQSYIDFIRP